MSKTNAPLTDSRCSKATYNPDEDNRLKDSGGLFLELLPNGKKRWRLNFRQENGKVSTKTLGAFPDMSVNEARQNRDATLQFSLLDDLFAESTPTTELAVANLAAKKTTRTASTTLKTPSATEEVAKTSPTAKKTKSVDTTMPSKTTKTTKSTAKKTATTNASTKSVASKVAKKATASKTATTKVSGASKKTASKTTGSSSVKNALEKATSHRSVKKKSSAKKTTRTTEAQKALGQGESANVVKTPLSQAKKIESAPDQSDAWKWGGLTLNPNQGLVNQFAHIGERPDAETSTTLPEDQASKQHLDIEATKNALPTPTIAQSPIINSALTTTDTSQDVAGISLSAPAQTKPNVDLPLVPPMQPKPLVLNRVRRAPVPNPPTEQPATSEKEPLSVQISPARPARPSARVQVSPVKPAQPSTQVPPSVQVPPVKPAQPSIQVPPVIPVQASAQVPPAAQEQPKEATINPPLIRNTAASSAQTENVQTPKNKTTEFSSNPKNGMLKIAILVLLTVGVTWGIQTIRINDIQSLLNSTKQQVATLTVANKKAKQDLQESSSALARLQASLKEQQAQATKALTEALSGMGKLKSELSSVQKELASEEARRREAEAQVEQHQVFRSSLSDLRNSYTNNRD